MIKHFRQLALVGFVLLIGLLSGIYFRSHSPQQATAQSFSNSVSGSNVERHWAENWIQFSFSPSAALYESEMDMTPFDIFVNTQIALMKSPMILKSVVENPAIARLPNIQKQVDPIRWIAAKLTVEGALTNVKKSEIFIVTFDSVDSREAEMIVNAVVDSYLSYFQLQLMQQEQALQKSLIESKTSHEAIFQQLKQQLPKDFNPQIQPDISTTRILAQIERELRAIDHISERLIRLETSRGTASRVRVLQRAASQQSLQMP